MKKSLLILIIALFTSSLGFAQLTGSYAIPGAGPTGYPTLVAAIADLNSLGVGVGGVTFNIAAGYTETLSSATAGRITTLTSTEAKPIVFQKSGAGINPVIKAATLSGSSVLDGIIVLVGTDYVTFDGIDVIENNANITNRTEWGYAILVASATDGSQHIAIKNCAITLNKTNTASFGIYSRNHNATAVTAINPTNASGTISFCEIDNCTISNVYNGIAFYAFNAPNPYTFYGQSNHIGKVAGNSVTNFGGGSTPQPFAIYTIYQNDVIVANNNINGGNGTTTGLNGIYIATSNNANVDIYSNTVTLISAATGASVYGIYNQGSSTGTTNTVNIHNNIVEYCQQPGATANWYLISNAANNLNANIYNNIVRENSRQSTGGFSYMISSNGRSNDTENVYNNMVYNNTFSGTGTNVFYGIADNNASVNKAIYSNMVYDNYVGCSSMHGIFQQSGTNVSIYKNSIYGLSTNYEGPSLNYGIRINGGTNVNLYNNLISDLQAPFSNSSFALRGIVADNGSNIGVYYNTIYLEGSSVNTPFGSACMYASTSPILEMKNNIFVNKSTSNGTAVTSAFWRASGITGTYLTTSNNNDFYAGIPGPRNLVYFDGTVGFQSIADYRTFIAPADASSFSELPPFVNVSAAPFDLHINAAIPTQCESGGSVVSTPVDITVDFANTPRYPITGYPNNAASPATAPDAGAYEFAGISLDLSAPGMNFTPLDNTSLVTNRTLVVKITDANNVPVSGSGLPVLYWRINSGAYTASQGVHIPATDNYSFTFGAGVVETDVVQYYLVAQDMNTPSNVGSNPAAGASGFTANPPTCSTPPSAPYSYTIIRALSGVVTIGTGGTFPTLTGNGGLFAQINSKVLDGNITAKIISDLVEDGTHSLNQWLEDGVGNYSLIIQPDAAVERLISGSVANPMIRFVGALRTTIDGRFNGSGKYLRFKNNDLANSALELTNDSRFNTIRDCYWESGNTQTTVAKGGVIRISTSSRVFGNSNNSILNNVIRDLSNGSAQPHHGIFALGTPSAINSNNTISGNHIFNFTNSGIFISANNDSLVITGNSLYNNMNTPLTTTPRIFQFIPGEGGDASIIADNYIGGSEPMCGGTPWIHNSNGAYTAMYLSVGSIAPTEVYNNVISNIHSTNLGSGSAYGIFANNSTGFFHIGSMGGNIIGSVDTPNSILFDGTNSFRGIYYLSDVVGNTIENNVIGNIGWSKTSGNPMNIFGIELSNGVATVKNNKIFKMGTLNPGLQPTISGIGNKGTDGIINDIINNIIDLDGGASTDAIINGFYETSPGASGANYYFNTVYIHGPANTTKDSYAWRRAVGSPIVLKNNIFINERLAGGTGSNYAIYDNVIGSSLVSDYNDLYSSTGSLGYFNSLPIVNLAGWQTATSGDSHSVSSSAGFVSANDWHPTNLILNNAGIPINGITNDFSGATRSNPPDIGALEFNAIPIIQTLDASSITGSSAMLNGSVNPRDEIVIVYFEYGLTGTYGQTITATPSPITGNSTVSFSSNLTMLSPNTTYYYRAIAIINDNFYVGNQSTFNTAAIVPEVTTLNATNIGITSAKLNGLVNSNNQNASVTFEYGLTSIYGSTVISNPSTVIGNLDTPVQAEINNLESNKLYHFRVVAQNATGTSYGDNKTFYTVDANNPLSVSYTSTNLSCYGSNNGSITLTINGGVPPYSVSWIGPNGFVSTTSTISNLVAGAYIYTVQDFQSNHTSNQITIIQPDQVPSPTLTNLTVVYDGLVKTINALPAAGTVLLWHNAAVGGDVISAPSASDAGIYTAWVGSYNAILGCESTRVEATLTINKKDLNVVADNKSKCQNNPNPELTVSYNGFVAGQNAANLTTMPLVTTTAALNSLPGLYPITVSGAVSNNYAFTYVSGTLTVSSSPIINAGDAGFICVSDIFPIVTATASNYTTLLWSSSGNGTFSNTSLLNPTYTPSSQDIANGTVILTLTGNPGSNCSASDQILLTIQNDIPVSASIMLNTLEVCVGTPVSFSALTVNGGLSPSFQWKVNGANAGTNSAEFSYVPANGDVVTVVVTSSIGCAINNPATSNAITVNVTPNLTAGVYITSPDSEVCDFSPVTFTAFQVNGGLAPSYQWKVNGSNAGTNNSVFTYVPLNGDVVTVVLTSNHPCATTPIATSNAITMSVNQPLLELVANPINGGTVMGGGNFAEGTEVVIVATPASGWEFLNWENMAGEIVSSDPSFTYTIEQCYEQLTATFSSTAKIAGQLKYFNSQETVIPSPNSYSVFYVQLFENGIAVGDRQLVTHNLENGLDSYFEYSVESGKDYMLRIWEHPTSNLLENTWMWNMYGGVTSLDALIISYMVVESPLNVFPWIAETPTPVYTPLFSKVANVDNSAALSSLDSYVLQNRIVNNPEFTPFPGGSHNFKLATTKLTSHASSSYPNAPEKLFEPNGAYIATSAASSVYYDVLLNNMSNGLNVYNIYFVATGDLNAEYVPSTVSKTGAALNYNGVIAANVGDEILIPVHINQASDLAAMTLGFSYNNQLIKVNEVLGYQIYNIDQDNGVVNISWMDQNARSFNANEVLVVLKATILGDINDNSHFMELLPNTEFADVTANVLSDISLSTSYIETGVTSIDYVNNLVLIHDTYPNPFKDVTNISYTLPESGKVNIVVYNHIGQEVKALVDEVQQAGAHKLTVENADLSGAGTYFYRITLKNDTKVYSTKGKMLLIK